VTRSSIRKKARPPRVGVFGLLGSGNLGNDASLEVILDYLSSRQPDAVIDAMCMGPEHLTAEYGIDAIPLQSYRARAAGTSRGRAIVLKVCGKAIDACRTAAWTRRHDVVIVPGMGVLETSLPLRASGFPYAMFLLCVSGKLFGTKVALVSVGATDIKQRPTRWLFDTAARYAFYRSYRDRASLEAMRRRGVYQPGDLAYPDLVFALRIPEYGPGEPLTVGVGVMAYSGGNDDRNQADVIYRRYIAAMSRFVCWLAESGHQVRLFWGDDVDTDAVERIVAEVYARPGIDPALVVVEPCTSLREVMAKMAPMGSVVGTRYHSVLSALKLSKPTISLGYSAKHDALMADMRMSEFSLSARDLDADELIQRFGELESRAPELTEALRKRNFERVQELEDQFAILSEILFPNKDGESLRRVRRADSPA